METKEKAIIIFFNDESILADEYIESVENGEELTEQQEVLFDTLIKMEDVDYDGDEIVKYGNQEYFVLTDREAEEKWDEYLDNYIDECLEIPENLRFYFDDEKWKRDARMDGRAHSLAGYDGHENWVQVDGEDIYFYRTN